MKLNRAAKSSRVLVWQLLHRGNQKIPTSHLATTLICVYVINASMIREVFGSGFLREWSLTTIDILGHLFGHPLIFFVGSSNPTSRPKGSLLSRPQKMSIITKAQSRPRPAKPPRPSIRYLLVDRVASIRLVLRLSVMSCWCVISPAIPLRRRSHKRQQLVVMFFLRVFSRPAGLTTFVRNRFAGKRLIYWPWSVSFSRSTSARYRNLNYSGVHASVDQSLACGVYFL